LLSNDKALICLNNGRRKLKRRNTGMKNEGRKKGRKEGRQKRKAIINFLHNIVTCLGFS
jgi:hypothetical protein